MNRCENRHTPDEREYKCTVCGKELRELTPAEVYRDERIKRNMRLATPPDRKKDGVIKRKSRGGGPSLGCPKCSSKIINFTGRPVKFVKKSVKVACGDCHYIWRTCSIVAFSPTRQIEVRG